MGFHLVSWMKCFKIVALLATVFFSGQLLAQQSVDDGCCVKPPKPMKSPPCCYFQEGCTKWYLGAGISFADLFYFKSTQTDTTGSTVFFSSYDASNESTTSAPSLGYNVFLGYSFSDYLDVEFKALQIVRGFKNKSFVNYTSSTNQDDVFNGETKLTFISFGPYVLLNLPMYDWFTPYFRVGIVTDYLKFQSSASEDGTFNSNGTLTGTTQKDSFWFEKLNFGLGFKSTWWDCFSLKVEYETPTANNISVAHLFETVGDFYIPGILSASALFEF